MKQCLECDKPMRARGYCVSHYGKKFQRHGGVRMSEIKLETEQQKEDLWQFVKKELKIR